MGVHFYDALTGIDRPIATPGLQGKIGGLQRRQSTLQADLDAKRAELVATQAKLREERARLAVRVKQLLTPAWCRAPAGTGT